MLDQFIEWKPSAETLQRVQWCQAIVVEYERLGITLTLRQLYYQLVQRRIAADMVRDVEERLRLFMRDSGPDLAVEKLALTMEQIRKHKPPPNPAKQSDSRAAAYIAQHGAQSWEVDALDPQTLQKLVDSAIGALCDVKRMQRIMHKEDADKAKLRTAAKRIAG